MADCYASTTVNLATTLGFFSKMCSLESPEKLESEHHLVTALIMESWPGVLQMIQTHIKVWKVGLEAEIEFSVSEAYSLRLMRNLWSDQSWQFCAEAIIHSTCQWWKRQAREDDR